MQRTEDGTIIITEDEARGGVTGHNVRYVLGFGLLGVIVAFAAIAVYFGYDRMAESLSQVSERGLVSAVQDNAPYVLVFLLGAMVAFLLLGVWSLVAGHADSVSQAGMRARVVIQFALIGVIMTVLYISRS